MKHWQMGLVVAGAAVAGGVALRMAEAPAVPAAAVASAAPEVAASVTPPPMAAPGQVTRWKTVTEPSEVVSSAPPAVYTEPSPAPVRTVPPPPVKRKPFPEPVQVAQARTEAVMKAPPPVPYQEPPKPARHVTLEAGMRITVRVFPGDESRAVLERAVIADGLEVGERGARVGVRAEGGNRFRLVSFQTADGQRVEVSAEPAAAVGDVVEFRLAARVTVTERKL